MSPFPLSSRIPIAGFPFPRPAFDLDRPSPPPLYHRRHPLPHREKALIGSRRSNGDPYLVDKMTWRKNLTSGRTVRRATSARDASLFTAHSFWPLIRRRSAPRRPLFKAANRRNCNRVLKAIMANLGALMPSAKDRTHGLMGPSASPGAWHPHLVGDMWTCPKTASLAARSSSAPIWTRPPTRRLSTCVVLSYQTVGRSCSSAFPWVVGYPRLIRALWEARCSPLGGFPPAAPLETLGFSDSI